MADETDETDNTDNTDDTDDTDSWHIRTTARVKHEGTTLYNYMTDNITTMLYRPTIEVRHECNCAIDIDEMNEKHSEDIKKNLIPWILNELERGQLFNNQQWMPFSDNCNPSDIYLAYRKLFEFQGHYFCLGVESDYHIELECKPNNPICVACNKYHDIQFCLAYYASYASYASYANNLITMVPEVSNRCWKSNW